MPRPRTTFNAVANFASLGGREEAKARMTLSANASISISGDPSALLRLMSLRLQGRASGHLSLTTLSHPFILTNNF